MSKGTTTSTGIVHSYFANVFGPVQYKEVHDAIAVSVFEISFNLGKLLGLSMNLTFGFDFLGEVSNPDYFAFRVGFFQGFFQELFLH